VVAREAYRTTATDRIGGIGSGSSRVGGRVGGLSPLGQCRAGSSGELKQPQAALRIHEPSLTNLP